MARSTFEFFTPLGFLEVTNPYSQTIFSFEIAL